VLPAVSVRLIETLAELDGAADPASMAPAAWWQQPCMHILAEIGDEPFAAVWREAGMLDVISQDALSN
jgi:hypothetical protein